MHMRLAACSLAAIVAVLMSAPVAVAADDPVLCGPNANAVRAAVGNGVRLNQLLSHPRAASCPDALALAQQQLRSIAPASPPPPPPVVSPPFSPPPTRVSPPPPVIRSDPAAEEAAAWRIASRTDTIAAYNAYLADYPNGRNAPTARQRIAALTPRVSPPPPPPPPVASLTSGQTFRDCADCPEMVVIPGGSFVMGKPKNEEAWSGYDGREEPQRTVSIRAFAAGKFEVTFDEWAACVAGGGCRSNANPGDQGWGRGRRPVINVSWNDAQEYVKWLSSETGQSYRLLTEAEWEYATRGKTSGTANEPAFWWGNSITTNQANYDGNYTYNGSPKGEYRQRTVPVGSFSANSFGLYDVHGNVWEWVQDCYEGSYAGAATDSSAVKPGTECTSSRVLRGGSWDISPRYLRSAFRFRVSPTDRVDFVGFRLARTVSPPNR